MQTNRSTLTAAEATIAGLRPDLCSSTRCGCLFRNGSDTEAAALCLVELIGVHPVHPRPFSSAIHPANAASFWSWRHGGPSVFPSALILC